MADVAGSSSAQSKNDKPVIVRVKRKAFQSRLDAFWLEINDRPLKRPLIDFEKLSLSQSSTKVEEVKTKKVFVQHIETLSNSEVKVDVLRSFVPETLSTGDSVTKSEEKRRTFKTENKQEQLLGKAKKEHEISSKSARFEQVWRKRKGTKEANHDEALKEMCHLYDVVRVDVPETTHEEKEYRNTEMEEEERMMMSSLLPLLRECVPDAASEIESEIDNYIFKGAGKDDYVYDLYAVKDDGTMMSEDALNIFPLVQVDDNDDDFYDGPDESENESYDSNAEDNAMNEYPDEETSSDEETQSKSSNDISEEDENSVSGDEDLQPEHKEDAFFDDGSGLDDYFDNELDDFDDNDDYIYDDDNHHQFK